MAGSSFDYQGLAFHALAQCFDDALLVRHELARPVYGFVVVSVQQEATIPVQLPC